MRRENDMDRSGLTNKKGSPKKPSAEKKQEVDQDTVKDICCRFRRVVFGDDRDRVHSEQEWKEKKNFILTNDKDKSLSWPFFFSLIVQDAAFLGFTGVFISIIGVWLMFAIYLFREHSGLWNKGNSLCSLFESVFAFNEIHDNAFVLLGVIIVLGMLTCTLYLFGAHALQVRYQCRKDQLEPSKNPQILVLGSILKHKKCILCISYGICFFGSFISGILFRVKGFSDTILFYYFIPAGYFWWLKLLFPIANKEDRRKKNSLSRIYLFIMQHKDVIAFIAFELLGGLLGFFSISLGIEKYRDIINPIAELYNLIVFGIMVYIISIVPGVYIFYEKVGIDAIRILFPKIYDLFESKSKKNVKVDLSSGDEHTQIEVAKKENADERTYLAWFEYDLTKIWKTISIVAAIIIGMIFMICFL